MDKNQRDWVIKPNEARIEVAIGHDAALTPELAAALEHLAQVLGAEDEVQGYMKCETVMACVKVTVSNCEWLISCSEVYR